MALGTYTELLQEINEWAIVPDVSTKAPTFVQQAESRHKRDVRVRAMVKRSVYDSSQTTDRFVSLPLGFLEMQSLRALDSLPYALKEVSRETLNVSNSGERPTQFCTYDQTLEVNRTPSVDLEMVFWAEFTPLSQSQQTNWLLTNAPNAYLFGALVMAYAYDQDDEQAAKFELMYKKEISELQAQDDRSRFKGAQTRPDLVWTP